MTLRSRIFYSQATPLLWQHSAPLWRGLEPKFAPGAVRYGSPVGRYQWIVLMPKGGLLLEPAYFTAQATTLLWQPSAPLVTWTWVIVHPGSCPVWFTCKEISVTRPHAQGWGFDARTGLLHAPKKYSWIILHPTKPSQGSFGDLYALLIFQPTKLLSCLG